MNAFEVNVWENATESMHNRLGNDKEEKHINFKPWEWKQCPLHLSADLQFQSEDAVDDMENSAVLIFHQKKVLSKMSLLCKAMGLARFNHTLTLPRSKSILHATSQDLKCDYTYMYLVE